MLDLPVLEPNLDLSRAQARDLPREPFSVSGIRMRLLCKFTHQKSSLLMCKSGEWSGYDPEPKKNRCGLT